MQYDLIYDENALPCTTIKNILNLVDCIYPNLHSTQKLRLQLTLIKFLYLYFIDIKRTKATKQGVRDLENEVFLWHIRERAFERLNPPWQQFKVIERNGSIQSNGTVKISY